MANSRNFKDSITIPWGTNRNEKVSTMMYNQLNPVSRLEKNKNLKIVNHSNGLSYLRTYC